MKLNLKSNQLIESLRTEGRASLWGFRAQGYEGVLCPSNFEVKHTFIETFAKFNGLKKSKNKITEKARGYLKV